MSSRSLSNGNDKCVPLSHVRNEIENLISIAHNSGDKEMESIFRSQLEDMRRGGARKTRRNRMRQRGGATSLCHAVTTAMFMSGSAAVTYLSYITVFPVVSKSLPVLCGEGVKDQLLSAVLGVWNKELTCASRQAKWDLLRANVIKYALGAQAMAVFTDKALTGKSKLIGYYKKLLSWNEDNLCPLIETATSKSTKIACSFITAPFRAAMAIGRGAKTGIRLVGETFDTIHGLGDEEYEVVGDDVSRETKKASAETIKTHESPKKITLSNLGRSKSMTNLKRARSSSPGSNSQTRRRARSVSSDSSRKLKGGRKTRRRHNKY